MCRLLEAGSPWRLGEKDTSARKAYGLLNLRREISCFFCEVDVLSFLLWCGRVYQSTGLWLKGQRRLQTGVLGCAPCFAIGTRREPEAGS